MGISFSYGVMHFVEHCEEFSLEGILNFPRIWNNCATWIFNMNFKSPKIHMYSPTIRHFSQLSRRFATPFGAYSESDATPIVYKINVNASDFALLWSVGELNVIPKLVETPREWFASLPKTLSERKLIPCVREWQSPYISLEGSMLRLKTEMIYDEYIMEYYNTLYEFSITANEEKPTYLDEEAIFFGEHIRFLLPKWHTIAFQSVNENHPTYPSLTFDSLAFNIATHYHDEHIDNYLEQEDR